MEIQAGDDPVQLVSGNKETAWSASLQKQGAFHAVLEYVCYFSYKPPLLELNAVMCLQLYMYYRNMNDDNPQQIWAKPKLCSFNGSVHTFTLFSSHFPPNFSQY